MNEFWLVKSKSLSKLNLQPKTNIMKKLVFTTVFICTVMSLSRAQGIETSAKGKAVVYFMRISAAEFAIKFSYFDNDKFIGEFNGSKYMRYECEPGEHLFWVNMAGLRDFITAELEVGKIYFVEVKPVMNVLYSEWQLFPVDPKDVKKLSKWTYARSLKFLQNHRLYPSILHQKQSFA